jgi:hypothetical protein
MNRKDYIAIAAIFAKEKAEDATLNEDFARGLEWNRCYLADRLADYFAEDNEHFDRDRFLAACDVL